MFFYPNSVSSTVSIIISASIIFVFLLFPIIKLELQILFINLGIPFDALIIDSRALELNISTVHLAPVKRDNTPVTEKKGFLYKVCSTTIQVSEGSF